MSSSNTSWDNCHVLLYAVNDDGTVDPKWTRPIELIENTYVPGLYFYGCKASKFGIRIVKGATHYAIVDLNAPTDKLFRFHAPIPLGKGRSNYNINGHFLTTRYTENYLKLTITQHKTLREAKRSISFKKENES
jgi:hypothetical protein